MNKELKEEQSSIRRLLFEKQCEIRLNPNLTKEELKKTKNFYLPRIKNKDLECCPYSIGDELCESCFHTKEPETNSEANIKPELIIVPALAVDKCRYRLGYGGGFYDRFLKDYKGKTVVCIPKELVFKTVYPEKHDIKINKIINQD